MSFSMARHQKTRYLKKYHSPLINVTLQVRIQPNENNRQRFFAYHAKKAFLTVPRHPGTGQIWEMSASLSLEAALVLSLFIFAVICMILPMKVMNTERKIQAALEAVGEDFSRYAYLKDMLERGEEQNIPGAGEFAKSFCGHLMAGAAEGYAQAAVLWHADTSAVKHVRMFRSSILEEDGIIDLILDYEIQLPFPVLGLKAIERTARCRRRAWIGKPGKEGHTGSGGGDGRDEIVYVGKNSTRYHQNRSCHYLANDLAAVAYEQVSGMRNGSGGKYYACRICGSGAGGGSTVYIMPSGGSYHASRNCTAINAYVSAARLSEVEHLGACSYCSR